MTTKQLLEKLENKSSFALAWAMIWRGWVLMFLAYVAIAIMLGVLVVIGSFL